MKKYSDPFHIPYSELVVEYKGKEMHLINKRLLDSQNCWENLEKIKALHVKRYELFDKLGKTKKLEKLQEIDLDLKNLEFELQDLWGFPRDVNFHKFWNRPKCLCPKIDNDDRYPTGYYIIAGKCPLHGTEEKG